MKLFLLLLFGVCAVFGDKPVLKKCEIRNRNFQGMTPVAKGTKLTLDGGSDGNEKFTPKTKLTVDFNIKQSFAPDAVAHVALTLKKYILFGYVEIPYWVYNTALSLITLPKGLTHVKDNVFAVTCEALTAKNITACPPKVGDGKAFVDFAPVFEQQKRLTNSIVGKFVASGWYYIHAEAFVMKDGDRKPYPLTCVELEVQAKISSK